MAAKKTAARYHVVAINEKTGLRTILTSAPLGLGRAQIMCSKFNPARNVRIQVEPARRGGGGANMVPALSYYATRGGGGAASAPKVKSGRELLDAAIGRIESKSIRAWATSPHNAPIWLKMAESYFKKNGGGEDSILKLSTYMVLTAMG